MFFVYIGDKCTGSRGDRSTTFLAYLMRIVVTKGCGNFEFQCLSASNSTS